VYRYKNADGRMKQVRLGHWPAVSAAAAVVEWERLRQERAAGTDPAAQRKAARQAVAQRMERRAQPTVFDVADEYVEGHLKPTASRGHYAACRRMADAMLGDVAAIIAAAVTRQQAFDLIDGHKGSPVLARQLRQLLGAAWDHALDAGRLPADAPNWWRLILRGKLRSRGRVVKGEHVGTGKRVLSDAEVATLIRWLPNYTPIVADVLTLYLWTGCRGIEIVTMEAHEVAEEAGVLWWTIPKRKRKVRGHEEATDLRVPLIGRAAAIVRRRLQEHRRGFLFASEDSHIRQRSVRQAVYMRHPDVDADKRWTRERLDLAHWAPHDLRRTVRTMLASLGCPADIAEAIIGHMQPGIESVYNRYSYDQERVLWLTTLDRRLEQLAAAGPHSPAATGPTPAAPRPTRGARAAATPRVPG
jgi:integrase